MFQIGALNNTTSNVNFKSSQSRQTSMINLNNKGDQFVSFRANLAKNVENIEPIINNAFTNKKLPKIENNDMACKVYAGFIRKAFATMNCDPKILNLAKTEATESLAALPVDTKIKNFDDLLNIPQHLFSRVVNLHEILPNVDKLNRKQFKEGIELKWHEYRANLKTWEPIDGRVLPKVKEDEDALCKAYAKFLTKDAKRINIDPYLSVVANNAIDDLKALSTKTKIKNIDNLLDMSDAHFANMISLNNVINHIDELSEKHTEKALEKIIRYRQTTFNEFHPDADNFGSAASAALKTALDHNKISSEKAKAIEKKINAGICLRNGRQKDLLAAERREEISAFRQMGIDLED